MAEKKVDKMEILEWIKFIVGVIFLVLGMAMFTIELLGVFHLKYVLNRMHMAATGDTLGIFLSLVGLMFMSGLNFTSLKLGLVIIFLWLSSPVSSHLIARLEVTTNPDNGMYEVEEKNPSSSNR